MTSFGRFWRLFFCWTNRKQFRCIYEVNFTLNFFCPVSSAQWFLFCEWSLLWPFRFAVKLFAWKLMRLFMLFLYQFGTQFLLIWLSLSKCQIHFDFFHWPETSGSELGAVILTWWPHLASTSFYALLIRHVNARRNGYKKHFNRCVIFDDCVLPKEKSKRGTKTADGKAVSNQKTEKRAINSNLFWNAHRHQWIIEWEEKHRFQLTKNLRVLVVIGCAATFLSRMQKTLFRNSLAIDRSAGNEFYAKTAKKNVENLIRQWSSLVSTHK